MRLPRRHSILWKLTAALAVFCLLLISMHVDLNRRIGAASTRLSDASKHALSYYAWQAEDVWRKQGPAALEGFLNQLRKYENVWAVVVDNTHHSLTNVPLDKDSHHRLGFIRPLDWAMRGVPHPVIYIPFRDGSARLVLELPVRYDPRQSRALWTWLLHRALPVLLAVFLGALLYRHLMRPLSLMRRQAQRLSAGDLSARVGPQLTQRKDELGDLARSFDQMAARLESTVDYQQLLLRDLSHELRTPLSRLRVANEQVTDLRTLRDRLAAETTLMERLVNDTLDLLWLDSERPSLPVDEVDIASLWEVLCEDACFESGWPASRFLADIPEHCRVRGNINALAKALENIVRNAIRYSPDDAPIQLTAQRNGADWLLHIDDWGVGVAADQLEDIFKPFMRVEADRPGGAGFGLGLSIARSMLRLQHGDLWAESLPVGLRMVVRLPSV